MNVNLDGNEYRVYEIDFDASSNQVKKLRSYNYKDNSNNDSPKTNNNKVETDENKIYNNSLNKD